MLRSFVALQMDKTRCSSSKVTNGPSRTNGQENVLISNIMLCSESSDKLWFSRMRIWLLLFSIGHVIRCSMRTLWSRFVGANKSNKRPKPICQHILMLNQYLVYPNIDIWDLIKGILTEIIKPARGALILSWGNHFDPKTIWKEKIAAQACHNKL